MAVKVIACDFDGTLVSNAWPEIGAPNHELIRAMILEREMGNKVILWTCREGRMLRDAVDFCASHGLYFDAVNKNLPERIAQYGTDPRKIGADEYIDDLASTRYKLPYIPPQGKRASLVIYDDEGLTTITDEMMKQIESAMGVPLYSWQVKFLKGDNSCVPRDQRQNGKTFAYCVRLLLDKNHPKFNIKDEIVVQHLSDEHYGTQYDRWFRCKLCEINQFLKNIGLETNARESDV